MNERYLVLTPEKVVLSWEVASIASRGFAHAVDLALAIAVAGALARVAGIVVAPFGPEALNGVQSLVASVGFLAYFVVSEWRWQGLTIGKRAFQLRVLMADGTPVTFSAALYRNFMRIADFAPAFYLLGTITMLLNHSSQRLGDLAAGTIVVRVPAFQGSYVPAPYHVGIHPLEHTVPDLRRMTIEEYIAIKRFCDRFPELPDHTANTGLTSIWIPFAKLHGISPLADVHPLYQMEAVVMKFGRTHNLV